MILLSIWGEQTCSNFKGGNAASDFPLRTDFDNSDIREGMWQWETGIFANYWTGFRCVTNYWQRSKQTVESKKEQKE